MGAACVKNQQNRDGATGAASLPVLWSPSTLDPARRYPFRAAALRNASRRLRHEMLVERVYRNREPSSELRTRFEQQLADEVAARLQEQLLLSALSSAGPTAAAGSAYVTDAPIGDAYLETQTPVAREVAALPSSGIDTAACVNELSQLAAQHPHSLQGLGPVSPPPPPSPARTSHLFTPPLPPGLPDAGGGHPSRSPSRTPPPLSPSARRGNHLSPAARMFQRTYDDAREIMRTDAFVVFVLTPSSGCYVTTTVSPTLERTKFIEDDHASARIHSPRKGWRVAAPPVSILCASASTAPAAAAAAVTTQFSALSDAETSNSTLLSPKAAAAAAAAAAARRESDTVERGSRSPTASDGRIIVLSAPVLPPLPARSPQLAPSRSTSSQALPEPASDWGCLVPRVSSASPSLLPTLSGPRAPIGYHISPKATAYLTEEFQRELFGGTTESYRLNVAIPVTRTALALSPAHTSSSPAATLPPLEGTSTRRWSAASLEGSGSTTRAGAAAATAIPLQRTEEPSAAELALSPLGGAGAGRRVLGTMLRIDSFGRRAK